MSNTRGVCRGPSTCNSTDGFTPSVVRVSVWTKEQKSIGAGDLGLQGLPSKRGGWVLFLPHPPTKQNILLPHWATQLAQAAIAALTKAAGDDRSRSLRWELVACAQVSRDTGDALGELAWPLAAGPDGWGCPPGSYSRSASPTGCLADIRASQVARDASTYAAEPQLDLCWLQSELRHSARMGKPA